MTPTPGSGTPTATSRGPEGAARTRRIHRFTWGERALHWLLAACVSVMIWTGLLLSVPAFAQISDRPTAKQWHLWSAWALVIGAAVLVTVHRRRLWGTVRDLERMTRDDLRWLRRIPWRILDREAPPPQGRFNAGQKLNAAVTLGLVAVTYVTGILLWLGERENDLRMDGTILVHDTAMYLLILLIAGHVWMAVGNPATSPALRGIVTGWVDRAWARRHHPDWVRAVEREDDGAGPPGSAGGAGARRGRTEPGRPGGEQGP